ncbi:hypothetical protein [Vibrio breoganii]|uniref:hypothetical protein n=1 Tax=Vibrio breoganii TaxID=553239 RepID=UPI000C83DF97|nr:hypothetical protein [Vibrio breoganii]PML53115.1 hypothetical protein BCT73_17410 [Vibrio breoganii]PMO83419.1 hypothetical protein BCT00_05245 [Vibrio breoganii]
MPNLTKEQQKLLKWMCTGRTFKVCSDYGPTKGDIIPKQKLPVRVFANTVDKLYRAGLITFTPVIYFGLRWDEFSLTRSGREVICKSA